MATGIEVGFGTGSIFGVGVGDAATAKFKSEFADATRDVTEANPEQPKSAMITIRTLNFINQILTKKLFVTNHTDYLGRIGPSGL